VPREADLELDAVVDAAAIEAEATLPLPRGDLLRAVATVGVDPLLRDAAASAELFGDVESEREGIATASAVVAAAVTTGVDEGLVSGVDELAFLAASEEDWALLPLLLPPQGLQETNLPNADGARYELGCDVLTLSELDPSCADLSACCAMLSLRMTLPLLPPAFPPRRVARAMMLLRSVPAALAPRGRRESWLGRA
jgi:hypothetical protein